MKLQKIGLTLFIISIIVAILVMAQSIIIPLILAIFLWFIIKEIREFMDKASWIKSKIPRWVKTVIASLVLISLLGLFANLVLFNAENLAGSLDTYSKNMDKIIQTVDANFGLGLESKLTNLSGNLNFQNIATRFLNSISDLFSNVFLILIYLIFILMEESSFALKKRAIYSDKEKYDEINGILLQIDYSLGKYISIKTLISFITAFASFLILIAIDVDFALFWSFCIFILNYIPSVGSLIATVFPATMALIQEGGESFTPFILVLVLVGIVQLIVGNFLEPKMMGNSLNISSLVVILSLSVWGVIWGIVGMVLSVPITVMMIIVFSHFKSTKNVAILLSEKGKLSLKNKL